MKRLLLIVCCLVASIFSFAAHLKGGWIQYEYISSDPTSNTSKYRITVKQYLLCTSAGGQIDANIFLGIYNAANNSLMNGSAITVPLSGTVFLDNTTTNPCITGSTSDKNVCYRVDSYITTVDLPDNTAGYILAVQRCCRIAGIVNILNSDQAGITYTNKIPGVINGTVVRNNNSAVFAQKDSAIVCHNGYFTLDFGATDSDGDSLAYTLCNGLIGGDQSAAGTIPNPPSNPPYTSVSYSGGFSGSFPLGSGVSINSKTGLISGIAPNAIGEYVVAVCAEEYRNGIMIGSTKKEIHVKVANCQAATPDLGPDDRTCNGFDFVFSDSTTNAFTSYLWTFGDGGSSTLPQPPHSYTVAGVYTVTLKVTASGGCQDSASKLVYVFPGFVPKFTVAGSCYLNPYQFNSTTFTAYGVVDTTKWNFGDPATLADTSNLPNPTYVYPGIGTYPIHLYATNSKGCQKDTTIDLVVADKPQIQLPFSDTLICSIDTLQLFANANGGNYSWIANPSLPNSIVNPNAQNPLVFPKDTTLFIVTVNNNGCINKDTVTVKVLDFITVDAGLDTTACRTDTFRLQPISHALSYLWTASTGVSVSPEKYPLVQPLTTTKYYVNANLGKCQDRDSVTVKVAPYPQVNVADVPAICYGNSVQLNGTIVGSNFSWSPTTNILFANTLTPTVNPTDTTLYILTATDTVGCPKPVKDTVIVVVIPPVTANAGKDTAVVINQPLQMFVATNAASLSPVTHFAWTPNFALNNDTIQNPIATINITADSIKYHVQVTTADGCIGQDDIVVKVFKTAPDIFVPTAFTPNRDGKNDILKPITVGIIRLDYFRVYNRWGQLLFQTAEFDKGWDGRVSGTEQDSGTYVFVAQGVDYTGKVVFRKGTVVLIH